jgi:hypothetical protein
MILSYHTNNRIQNEVDLRRKEQRQREKAEKKAKELEEENKKLKAQIGGLQKRNKIYVAD